MKVENEKPTSQRIKYLFNRSLTFNSVSKSLKKVSYTQRYIKYIKLHNGTKSTQIYTKVHQGTQRYAKVHKGTQSYTKVQKCTKSIQVHKQVQKGTKI